MNKRTVFREYLLMTLGTAIVAAGVYFFKFPNNISTGGVAGMAHQRGKEKARQRK